MGRKKNIALFMGILENDFSLAVLNGAIMGAKECDVNLIVFPVDLIDALYLEEAIYAYRYQYNTLTSYLKAQSLDGIMIEYGTITSALTAEKKEEFLSCIGDTPTILLAEKAEGYTSITVDNSDGLIELLEHLIINHKYTRIGYLSGPKNNRDAEERLQVFKDTMKKNNLYPDEDWIAYGNFTSFVEDIVTDMIKKHPDMEVLVCANDGMALGAANAMRKMGIEPGKDMFLTGFDDIIAGFLCTPALTTVKADPEELSYQAVRRLCGVDGDDGNTSTKTRMRIRESCGCRNFVPDEKWKRRLGISSDWREVAQYQFGEAEARRNLEHELGNVTREMVFACNTEKERYKTILDTFRRLCFKSCGLFLYDNFICHTRGAKWVNPEIINLVGYYSDGNQGKSFTCALGEKMVDTARLLDYAIPQDDARHEVVVIPLFFGVHQIGILVAESEPKKFFYAYDMAVQISNTLYIIAMNEEQKKMKNALEEANKAKSQFLANMSHEIRTPINAIIGFDEMILRESQESGIADYAGDIKSAADALLLLVNDILDFSKIEAGKMELVITDYSLFELLQGVVGMMNSRAEKKGLALFLDYDKSLPAVLSGDFGRLQQILLNLMSNAVKYTEKGTVTLAVHGEVTDGIVRLEFRVEDTGIGIKEEDIERLFNEFERIDEKRNRHIEGTGLGINITTGLLRLMSSELKVQSTYGKGSVFSFVVEQRIVNHRPIGEAALDPKKDERDSAVRIEAPEAKILVVDDNRMNLKVICSLLKETRMEVDQAESGMKCMEMVAAKAYDVILLDHMMPEMDGIETLNRMLEEKMICPDTTPVIALTANAVVGARETYLESGFSDYLSKPVRPKELYAMLIKYIPADKIQYT